MFNWVCPRCGKDVPPSKTVCPYCADVQAQAPPPAGPQQGVPHGYPPPPPPPESPQGAPPQGWHPQQQWTPPPPPQYTPPPPPPQEFAPPPPSSHPQPHAAWQPPPPHYQQPHYDPNAPHGHWPARKPGPPAWLVGGGVALLLLLVLGGAYYLMQPGTGKGDSGEKAAPAANAAPAEEAANPFQKYVEVVGIRLVTEKGKPTARVVVVNHSSADINGLEANVTLWASTKRSEEDSIGTFKIKVARLTANGSADAAAPLNTKLKPYELPDWQNLTAELQITSPKP